MYIAFTNIWDRYRVIKIRVTSTFYPTSSSAPLFAVQYPYRSDVSGVVDINSIEGMPDVIIKPLPNLNTKPVTISKMYNLSDLYKVYGDSSEDGKEGPLVWAQATHQWNKIPTYCPFIQTGVYAFRNVPSTIDAIWTVDVDYFVELTNRLPYNTSALTVPMLTKIVADGETTLTT
jgi:hypothetical protein